MEIIAAICFLTLVLLVWFKTEAFVEYMRLFRLGKWLHVDESVDVPDLSYPEFLKEYFNSFFTRLISCPICLSVWVGFILSLFIHILAFPIITILGLSSYLLISKLL